MKSIVSAFMVTLILVGTLIVAFDIRPVKASGTVYIRADGSIDPPTAPIASVDNVTYTFTGSMNASFTIERDNIVVDGAGFTIWGADSVVAISGRNNVTVQNMTFRYEQDWWPIGVPLLIELSTCIKVVESVLGPANMTEALQISSSSDCLIYKNEIGTATEPIDGNGISISSSTSIIIRENHFEHLYGPGYKTGLSISSGSHNIVEGNYFESRLSISSSGANNTIFNNTLYTDRTEAIFVSGPSNSITGNQMSVHHSDFTGRALVVSSANNTIIGNEIHGCVFYGSDNEIYGNTISELYLVSASRNMIHGNGIAFLCLQIDSWGMETGNCSDNTFYRNSIEDLHYHFEGGELPALPNVWDDGYPSGGNYWGSYTGPDLYGGPYQNETGSDGIVDTPFLIAPNNRDNYPFTQPCYDLDAAITQVSASRTAIPQGELLSVNVTVANQGLLPITFNLTVDATHTYAPVERPAWLRASAAQGWNSSVPGPTITVYLGDTVALTLESADSLHHLFYVDLNSNQFPDGGEPQSPSFINEIITFRFSATTLGTFTYYCAYNQGTMYGELLVVTPPPPLIVQMGSQSVSLAQNEEKTITFTWNTTGFAKGRYDISAYAAPVLGEVDTSDNTLIDGWVFVTIAGDVDGDRDVDIFDIVRMAGAYGTSTGDVKYVANCDIDGDGDIGIFDLVRAAGNYGKSW